MYDACAGDIELRHAEALICVVALLAKRPDPTTVHLHFNERTIVCETYVGTPHRERFRVDAKKGEKHDL